NSRTLSTSSLVRTALKMPSNRSARLRTVSGLQISPSSQRPLPQRYKRFWRRTSSMRSVRSLMSTTAPASVILIRLAVGCVFLSEGIQKFLFPNDLAAGRFLKIGIPAPEIMGPFVGVVEVVCGSLIILGLLTRLAAILLIIDMCVALVSTKLPILLGHS